MPQDAFFDCMFSVMSVGKDYGYVLEVLAEIEQE
jgi:hypothetical protein